jgi:hypothetical protein
VVLDCRATADEAAAGAADAASGDVAEAAAGVVAAATAVGATGVGVVICREGELVAAATVGIAASGAALTGRRVSWGALRAAVGDGSACGADRWTLTCVC